MTDLLEPLDPVQRHAGGLHVLHLRMSPGLVMDGHGHDEPTIVVVLNGELQVSEMNEELVETSGTLRLSPPYSSRKICTMNGAEVLIISCDPSQSVARHMIWQRMSSEKSTRFRVESEGALMIQAVRSEPGAAPDIESICLGLLNRVLDEIAPEERAPGWFRRALADLSETSWHRGAGEKVARSLGIHPVHLARTIRRFTGLTLRDHLRRARIIRGSHFLRSSNKPLSFVAHESGFADHSHFTREFVWRHGFTPSHDRLNGLSDVVSIQASQFPATHLGSMSSSHQSNVEAGHAMDVTL